LRVEACYANGEVEEPNARSVPIPSQQSLLLITFAGIRIRPIRSYTANTDTKSINETKWIIMYIWTGG